MEDRGEVGGGEDEDERGRGVGEKRGSQGNEEGDCLRV